MTPAFLCEAIPEDGPVPQLSVKPLNSDRKVFVAYSDKLPRVAEHYSLGKNATIPQATSSPDKATYSGTCMTYSTSCPLRASFSAFSTPPSAPIWKLAHVNGRRLTFSSCTLFKERMLSCSSLCSRHALHIYGLPGLPLLPRLYRLFVANLPGVKFVLERLRHA